MSLWLCLDFHRLPLEVFGTAEQPLALAEQRRILLANDAAQAAGVEAGMAAATAQALCADLTLREREPERERAAIETLATWAYRFTPTISPREDRYLLLEVGGCRKLFGGLTPLQQRISDELAQLGYSARRGLAASAEAALLLCGDSLAVDKEPDRHALRQQLAALPVEALRITPTQRKALRDMGLSQLGQVLELPLAALGRRFGRDFVDYLQRLLGDRSEPLPLFQPAPRFARRRELLEPLHNHQALLFPMGQLLRDFCHYLQARQRLCLGFQWRFTPRDGRQITLAVSLSAANNSYQSFLSLSRLKLESLHSREPIDAIELRSRHFSETAPGNLDLFGETSAAATLAPTALLDKLNARLGERAVYRLQVKEDCVPEAAWQRLTAGARPGTADTPRSRRPLWLLHRPAPIHRRGEQLHWREPLQLLRGPERIDGHWWRRPVQRDYFLARAESGALLWVFRELESERWYVHGLFG